MGFGVWWFTFYPRNPNPKAKKTRVVNCPKEYGARLLGFGVWWFAFYPRNPNPKEKKTRVVNCPKEYGARPLGFRGPAGFQVYQKP